MITTGYNQVQEKHVADANSSAREDAHEAKKVYVGNKLAHVHVNDNTEFALRQTLNGYIHEDNDLYAKISSIKGNTKVWNQYSKATIIGFNGGVGTNVTDNTFTFVGQSSSTRKYITLRNCYLNSHVYYTVFYCKSNYAFTIQAESGIQDIAQASAFTKVSRIGARKSSSYSDLYFYLYEVTDSDWTLEVNNLNVIDLTLIYGAGNEPTTVAEFEADFQKWFGRPIGAEPYDAGSLIPFQATGIKSTGFNLWDEEWENGYYDSIGGKIVSNYFVRTKNFILVNPATDYYFKVPINNSRIYFYDSSQTFISSNNTLANKVFTTPNNCRYITFFYGDGSTTTYNHDSCINLSNPTLNGTYVPYKATTIPIPVTTLTGKAEGSTTSEVIFPDGMKSAGSVKDEVYVEDGKTYAVKRVGSVDLGTLSLNYSNTYTVFFITQSQLGNINSKLGNLFNGLQSKYKHIPNSITDPRLFEDKVFINRSDYISQSCVIKDSSYTDATAFQAAMSGVMLYYELATPIVYEVDNYTLPLYYPANGTGTEEIISTAATAPADMDIEYRLRQRVRLVDMGTPGVLWADSDIDITKPDGFCDSPFTYDKSFFSWGNVVGHNPISNTAFDYDWGGVNQAEPWYDGQPYGSTPGSTLTGNIPANAQYDAAKAILGGNWRTPSNAEYDNLFSICKFLEADGSDMDTSKTDKRVDMPDGNGGTVKGIYIESTVTGNRLFFSCSGRGNGRSWYGRGSYGDYWSSTWYSSRYARRLYFSSGGVDPQNSYYRCHGFALRPVYPISQ